MLYNAAITNVFNNPDTVNYFNHIFDFHMRRTVQGRDSVLTEVARALLWKRVPQASNRISFSIKDTYGREDWTPDSLINDLTRYMSVGEIRLVNIVDGEQFYKNAHANVDASKYFVISDDDHELIAYPHFDGKSVVIVNPKTVEYGNAWIYHLIAANIPQLLPEYFKHAPLNELEKKLLETIVNESATPDTITDALKAIYNAIDFNELKLEEFKEFTRKTGIIKIERIENRIANEMANCADLKRQYLSVKNRIENYNNQIIGLKSKQKKDGDDPLLEIFKNNKEISIKRMDHANTTLGFYVNSHLDYFDIDEYEDVFNNTESVMYNTENNDGYFDDKRIHARRALMRAIFSDEIMAIRVSMAFNLNFADNTYNLDRFDIDTNNYMPNPHLYHYSCFGGNEMYIEDAISEDRFSDAIMQMIVATKNINFSDLTVAGRFFDDLFVNYADSKIIMLKETGEFMSPKEAALWLERNGYVEDDDYTYDYDPEDDYEEDCDEDGDSEQHFDF